MDILGKEKAIEFFEQTKEIEHDGGMMIMNRSRRRTAGGIYLYLVKHDDHIPQEKIREIFYQEVMENVSRKKKNEANHRRQQTQELRRLVTRMSGLIFYEEVMI